MKSLAAILDAINEIDFRTTWQDAQQMLLDNTTFAQDSNLLGKNLIRREFTVSRGCFHKILLIISAMDKEDALIVFEEHIRELEREEAEDKEREKRRVKRLHRKNRDNFVVSISQPQILLSVKFDFSKPLAFCFRLCWMSFTSREN